MNVKLKICMGCEQPRPIWKRDKGKGYCRTCWQKESLSAAEPTERTTLPNTRKPIANRSVKRSKQEVKYSILRKEFLLKHPYCMIKLSPKCSYNSTQVHHSYSGKDRNAYFLAVNTWFATCFECHDYTHSHPKESRELGYLR